jgi:regulator of sigma E protease
MLSLIIFLFILSTLIIVHEFGHFIVAKRTGVRVEKFSLGFGPRLLTKKKDNTEYTLSAILLGGYVKMAGDSLQEYKGGPDEYFSKPPGKRFWIIFCGPLLNYLLGFLLFCSVFFAGYPTLTARVGGLIEGFGAKQAGIQAGDKIIAVDGEKVEFWEELQKIIRAKKTATKVLVSVLRDNKEQKIEVSIREKQLSGPLGEARNVGLLGITPDYDQIVKVRHSLGQSFVLGAKKTWELTAMTYKGLWRILTGKLPIRESVTGPLGILAIASKVAKLGIIALLHLVAVLSIGLGIFNLLPLPVLDGGHILLLGIEKIRGRGLGLKAEEIITQVGTTIIISLAIFVTYNDILRLFGDKLSKFFISR